MPNAPNQSNQSCCPNCYCYVCDIPASECTSWAAHCNAYYSSNYWKEQRRLKQVVRRMLAFSSFSPEEPSCSAILRKCEQVWPVQVAAPAGINATLRPYKEQSLAFMLHRERDASDGACGEFVSRHVITDPAGRGLNYDVATAFGYRARENKHIIRGGLLCDEMVSFVRLCDFQTVANRPTN